MTLFRPWLRLSLAAAVVVTGAGPASTAPTAPARFEHHPYIAALDAVANYRSCGARARTREGAALERALRAGEARAREKGLEAELERVRRDYLALLAVSSRVACARGPVAALQAAQAAVRAFRSWVEAAPVAGGSGRDRPAP